MRAKHRASRSQAPNGAPFGPPAAAGPLTTFLYFSKPKEAGDPVDLLESKDIAGHNLVLAYAGLISATPTDKELKDLKNTSNKRVQALANKVLEIHRVKQTD